MKTLGDKLADAYASWYTTLCCLPCLDEQPPRGNEKDVEIYRDQPGFTPPPMLEPWNQDARAYRKERVPRKSFGSLSRKSFSVRKTSRRPQISAPSDFRHVYSESFHFPTQPSSAPSRPRPASFRPLQLSLYMPENDVSPILPHFEQSHPDVTPPPPAHTHASSFDSDAATLAHQRSHSSMSFHLPRRPLPDAWPSTSLDESPPRIPPRSRLRANTAPSVERIVERIASAMIERDRIQAEIESIMERQSIYVSSRPSTAYGLEGEDAPSSIERRTLEYAQCSRLLLELEPLPAVPALPAAAPSFAERLSTERPLTARSQSEESQREKERAAMYAAPRRPVTPPRLSPRINGRPVDIPLAPPLPLVLRPPLRKKKSFSRVSNWLFPGDESQHQRDMSLDSVTNQPRPVRGRDGFYQCVDPAQASGLGRRNSVDTISTASTWTTEDRTMPTTWSPSSSPVTKQETPSSSTITVRRGTFGGRPVQNGPRPQSVGVAF